MDNDTRAKYKQADRDRMATSGQAMPDGSYPIADKEDLQNAIHAVGRGGADHDAIRRHVIKRAKALGAANMIPDNWNSDGSLKSANSETAPALIRGELQGVRETRNTPLAGFELRDQPDGSGGSKLVFTGYASVTESPYKVTDALGEYDETVARSAFDRTLSNNADVSFLVNHEGVSMARTRSGSLRLAADSRGLHVEANLNPNRPDVQIARAAIADGDLTEMSFAFRAIDQSWDEDYTTRRLNEVSLHRGDVSIVNYGANPATAGLLGVRSATAVRGLNRDRVMVALKEIRQATETLSPSCMATLNQVLTLVAGADQCVDQAQDILSDLMGVPNPDDTQDASMGRSEKPPLDVYRARALALRLRSA